MAFFVHDVDSLDAVCTNLSAAKVLWACCDGVNLLTLHFMLACNN